MLMKMKKSLFIIGLALTALTVSCSKDVDLQPAADKVVLGVTIESDTRTALGALNGGKYDVVWSEGDCLAVNGVKSEAVEAAYVGKTTAQFTVSGVEAPYNVLYPASVLGEDGNITVPAVQNYTEGSFAVGSAVAIGYATEASVTLKNLYSIVKLTIAKGDNVALKSVALQAVGGQAISGVFGVDYQNAEIRDIAGQSIIRVMDVPYGADNKAVVHIAVPAGKYDGGFTVTVTGADGKCMTKKASKITDVPAGYIVSMPEFTYTGTARSEVVITNATEFVDFATIYNNGFDGVALLGNDIDMTGVAELPYFSLLEEAVFDGQGYAIKNYAATHALINENWGTVKNVTVDSSCSWAYDLTNTNASTPHAVFVNANMGLVSGCINNANVTAIGGNVVKDRSIGTIVGVSGSTDFNLNNTSLKGIAARVENCINNGKLTIQMDDYTSGWIFIGGMVGSYYPHNVLDTEEKLAASYIGGVYNCVNNGDVEINITTLNKLSSFGGIVGCVGKVYNKPNDNKYIFSYVDNCVNNGNVTYSGTTVNGSLLFLGGVSGYCAGDMTNTTNGGAVKYSVPDATTQPIHIGGVTGWFCGNIMNVHNSGDVTLDNIKPDGYMFAGGIAGISQNGNYNGTPSQYITVENCSNSGAITVDYYAQSTRFHFVGGLFGDVPHSSPYDSKQKGGSVAFKSLENKGAVTIVNHNADMVSSICVGGIVGQAEKSNAVADGLVNYGNVSLSGNLNDNACVGGIMGTNDLSLANCQSYGDLSIMSDDTTKKVLIGGFGARLNNTATTWDNCILDCNITYDTTSSAIFGLLQADYWGSTNITTVGGTSPIKVKATTTVNGVAVTAADIANHYFLLGRDQKTDDRATSAFQIAEGGVVLE